MVYCLALFFSFTFIRSAYGVEYQLHGVVDIRATSTLPSGAVVVSEDGLFNMDNVDPEKTVTSFLAGAVDLSPGNVVTNVQTFEMLFTLFDNSAAYQFGSIDFPTRKCTLSKEGFGIIDSDDINPFFLDPGRAYVEIRKNERITPPLTGLELRFYERKSHTSPVLPSALFFQYSTVRSDSGIDSELTS